MNKRIAVFTSTRADYGLLRSVLIHLNSLPEIDLQLFVSGGHLADAQGMTIKEIEADGLPIAAYIDMELDTLSQPAYASLALVLKKSGVHLEKLRPHLLLLLGDRYETMGIAAVATILGIPLAHISGGESTIGSIDEAFRHAITKMSHLHFPSCEAHRQRVIQLGEAPERVWNVGALGVENAIHLPQLHEDKIRNDLGISPNQPYFLCTYHPVTLELGLEEIQCKSMLAALDQFPQYNVIFTSANIDPGGKIINHCLKTWEAKQPQRVKVFNSLGVVRYLSAARFADCVIGNSSSGIIEIPSLGTPVVNIGNRQRGRICSSAVLHCQTDKNEIIATLHYALSPQHKQIANFEPNPYEGENTAQRICNIICSYPLYDILKKKFYDISNCFKEVL